MFVGCSSLSCVVCSLSRVVWFVVLWLLRVLRLRCVLVVCCWSLFLARRSLLVGYWFLFCCWLVVVCRLFLLVVRWLICFVCCLMWIVCWLLVVIVGCDCRVSFFWLFRAVRCFFVSRQASWPVGCVKCVRCVCYVLLVGCVLFVIGVVRFVGYFVLLVAYCVLYVVGCFVL